VVGGVLVEAGDTTEGMDLLSGKQKHKGGYLSLLVLYLLFLSPFIISVVWLPPAPLLPLSSLNHFGNLPVFYHFCLRALHGVPADGYHCGS